MIITTLKKRKEKLKIMKCFVGYTKVEQMKIDPTHTEIEKNDL